MKHALLMSFKHSACGASYDKTSQGGKYYLRAISFSLDNTMCTCNLCQDKMRRGLVKDFASLQDSQMGEGLGSKLDSWLHAKIYFTTIRWLNDVTVHQTPHVFSDSLGICIKSIYSTKGILLKAVFKI